jgi:type IV pilus assembly protein PilX
MNRRLPKLAAQRGMALVTAMLLLVIITILALSMFRSVGTQEKVAGNVREKERALHSAESAQQYAEWWLLQNFSGTPTIVCGPPLLSANENEGALCSNTLTTLLGATGNGQLGSLVPWKVGGAPVGVTLLPQGMTTSAGGGWSPLTLGGVTTNTADFYAPPVFYIADVGKAADAQGEAFQIDAYGYGGSANAVAVVESVYEVAKGVFCLGGPGCS